MELSGGNRLTIFRRRSRIGVVATFGALFGAAILLTGCGGSSSSEPSGTREVKITTASFPSEQSLGQTSLMKIGVHNESEDTIPALTYTSRSPEARANGATLPFAIRDPQPGLAQPDRPVWVLAEHYPKLIGSSKPGGAEGAALKTYTFGPLKPGATRKPSGSSRRCGRAPIELRYSVGSTGEVKLETPDGAKPAGSFAATISPEVQNVTVNGAGEVVEVGNRGTPTSSVSPMDGRARACFIATALALIALQSCGAGSGDGTSGSGAGGSQGRAAGSR